jgi:4-hydroxybenzoate polyprenyltransferase
LDRSRRTAPDNTLSGDALTAVPNIAMVDAVMPLCVDLDGTLIRSDLLLESALLLIKHNPLYALVMPWWLLRGRAVLKAEIATRVKLNPQALPYDGPFVEWLTSERDSGRQLWLCTAADEQLANAVAAHVGLFRGVLASNRTSNLAGRTKAAELVKRFGAHGFDYCGNERRDLAVWAQAHGAIVVNGNAGLEREAAQRANVLRTFPATGHRGANILRALRPHQWAKNILLFLPLLAAHHASDAAALIAALLGFIAFSMCASSVYVLNDLLDLEVDRAHERKSKRPFAAGDVSLSTGLAIAPCLMIAALLIAVRLPDKFLWVLCGYFALTLAYSFLLKKIAVVDAMALAGLYTLRIIAGAAAVNVPLSFWLLLFSVFLFLSLALVKRFAELDSLRRSGRLRPTGRGYQVEDLALLQSLGTAAGYLSVLVLALYINSPQIESLYRQPKMIWLLCVLMLYWVSRVWMKAQRGLMHDDPVVFALRDRISLAVGLLAALTVLLAI